MCPPSASNLVHGVPIGTHAGLSRVLAATVSANAFRNRLNPNELKHCTI